MYKHIHLYLYVPGGSNISTIFPSSAFPFSIIGIRTLVTAILSPSIAASSIPPTKAFLPADLQPPRAASIPRKKVVVLDYIYAIKLMHKYFELLCMLIYVLYICVYIYIHIYMYIYIYIYIYNIPPVAAPDMIAFQGSSFFRTAAKEQSQQENNVPHIAKLPDLYLYIHIYIYI
jgi:hypothetical protein